LTILTIPPSEQLREYLAAKRDETGQEYIGILTDTLRFEVYHLDGEELTPDTSFTLTKDDPEAAFIQLDTYLFSQKQLIPTARDIVARFGSDSPTFKALNHQLEQLYNQARQSRHLDVWREQWNKLLSKVYGSPVGSDTLFLRHTYLSQFAKLLAYAALQDAPPTEASLVERILNGSAFNLFGVKNIGEHDFYSWVLDGRVRAQVIALFRRLALGLVVYDLSRIDQDLLKELYESLVEQHTRHGLGEYYTPDWLAELTLDEVQYAYPHSLLDPACGSGTFLFSAIKRLEKQGLTGWPLVEFAADQIMGLDVHPLAVSTARLNYLLALSPHMRENHPSGKTLELNLPVYMADALLRPLENEGVDVLTIPVDEQRTEVFKIPTQAALSARALSDVINDMEKFAEAAQGRGGKVPANILDHFSQSVRQKFDGLTEPGVKLWRENLELLARLMREDRNGIWAYILNNQSRPLLMAQQQFDVVAGNPPWLSYRYIQNEDYQNQVKALYRYYQLIETNDVKLFTQMDLSTLFWNLARDRYLKPGGQLAFVLPRAVITGAKQHRRFQQQGFTRVLDLLDIHPLIFNVPTCVLIDSGPRHREQIPARVYHGRLRARQLGLEEARPFLTWTEGKHQFVDSEVRSPHYYDQVFQGATLVPRNLVFIKPAGQPSSPAVATDPELDAEAKTPWKGVRLSGSVEDDYSYSTLLSKHLVPFGYEKLHLVALPVRR
ncbi:MAG TPA: N-6 DNA methylase, partial [Phototrophicaceae bacterium]|nr:N-6 DNA methylase [Phototrophicaceae bacterium]